MHFMILPRKYENYVSNFHMQFNSIGYNINTKGTFVQTFLMLKENIIELV